MSDRPPCVGADAGSDAAPRLPGTLVQNAAAVELAATIQQNFEALGI